MIKNSQSGFLITQIKQMGGRSFEKILSEKGIDAFNGAQGRILYILWQNEAISITELSEKTGLAKTTLTSMLDRLEGQELVKRIFDRSDRRKILIILSEKAKELQKEYDEVSERMNDIYFQGFSDSEILQFEGYLLRIIENLKGGNNNE